MMPSDPFLHSHYFSERIYEIGGGFADIGCQDMILRARMLIERLVEHKIVEPGDRILIIGSGVSGVATALQSARQGLRPTLVNDAAEILTRFAGITQRQVFPYLSIWPMTGWDSPTYPEPMPAPAGYINKVITIWRDKFNFFVNEVKIIHEINTTFLMSDLQQIIDTPENTLFEYKNEKYKLLIKGDGFGQEDIRIDKNGEDIGERYWSNNNTYEDNLLIVGGGDSAVEELIRAITNQHPFHVISKIENAINGAIESCNNVVISDAEKISIYKQKIAWEEAKSEIQSVYNLAFRKYLYNTKSKNQTLKYFDNKDKQICSWLDQKFTNIINRIFPHDGNADAIVYQQIEQILLIKQK